MLDFVVYIPKKPLRLLSIRICVTNVLAVGLPITFLV